jgi:hypothetical protein
MISMPDQSASAQTGSSVCTATPPSVSDAGPLGAKWGSALVHDTPFGVTSETVLPATTKAPVALGLA